MIETCCQRGDREEPDEGHYLYANRDEQQPIAEPPEAVCRTRRAPHVNACSSVAGTCPEAMVTSTPAEPDVTGPP